MPGEVAAVSKGKGMMKSSVNAASAWGCMMTETRSRTLSTRVVEILNFWCRNYKFDIYFFISFFYAYLEDDVLLENMFDARNLVLCLAFRELRRFIAAVENGSIGGKFRDFSELFRIRRLRISSRKGLGCSGDLFDGWCADRVKGTWP